MIFETDEPNLIDAGRAIRAEDESENFRDPIVEPTAISRILMLLALGTRCEMIILAA
jgi:hypothetical protein